MKKKKEVRNIKWLIAKENQILQKEISHHFSIDPTIAQLLINRGLDNYKEISYFLNPHLDNLVNYKLLHGLNKAVSRIIKALHKKEKILIYGDYDVDGMTSIALLFSILKKYTTDVYYYIPDRAEEGYGLSEIGMKFIIKHKITLMITVDCGITSFHEIEKLNEMEIDTVITDHHQPLEEKPNALAIINPKNCDYPFKELAGVGVVFKLVQALSLELEGNDDAVKQNLDLVALGTIADSVPILNENRIFVKEGLLQLINSNKKGLKILLEKIQNHKKQTGMMSVRDISFELIPVLNATGRIGNPNYAVDLFLTESSYKANHLVEEMLKLNEERKTITQKTLLEARKNVKGISPKDEQKILVLSSKNWHPGIIGIIASRIMEEFGKPAMIISTSNGKGKGSGRNQGEFDFSEILAECSQLLEKYGGHKYAAGITIAENNIDLFRNMINKKLSQNTLIKGSEQVINIDSNLDLNKMNWSLLNLLDLLKPFGPGNPQPIFCGYNYPLKSWKTVGKENNHLKLCLGKNGHYYDGIGFQLGEKSSALINQNKVNLVFQLDTNQWNGKKTIQLLIKDIKPVKEGF